MTPYATLGSSDSTESLRAQRAAQQAAHKDPSASAPPNPKRQPSHRAPGAIRTINTPTPKLSGRPRVQRATLGTLGFTNPFSNNGPLEPMRRLKKKDYHPCVTPAAITISRPQRLVSIPSFRRKRSREGFSPLDEEGMSLNERAFAKLLRTLFHPRTAEQKLPDEMPPMNERKRRQRGVEHRRD
ncbi:hypothetical protein Moror_16090 [Moniliophthora roreri MCA 2997]|uniref:Uncharacterized protein n=1 Tax=Moniliophthora roreri (strain MCA 2997) TaxID=1381753 RepID=V2X6U4_MONRO|nr:hypothetical protein Moror_16090 [Moniliophthora roreri MCA 2997]